MYQNTKNNMYDFIITNIYNEFKETLKVKGNNLDIIIEDYLYDIEKISFKEIAENISWFMEEYKENQENKRLNHLVRLNIVKILTISLLNEVKAGQEKNIKLEYMNEIKKYINWIDGIDNIKDYNQLFIIVKQIFQKSFTEEFLYFLTLSYDIVADKQNIETILKQYILSPQKESINTTQIKINARLEEIKICKEVITNKNSKPTIVLGCLKKLKSIIGTDEYIMELINSIKSNGTNEAINEIISKLNEQEFVYFLTLCDNKQIIKDTLRTILINKPERFSNGTKYPYLNFIINVKKLIKQKDEINTFMNYFIEVASAHQIYSYFTETLYNRHEIMIKQIKELESLNKSRVFKALMQEEEKFSLKNFFLKCNNKNNILHKDNILYMLEEIYRVITTHEYTMFIEEMYKATKNEMLIDCSKIVTKQQEFKVEKKFTAKDYKQEINNILKELENVTIPNTIINKFISFKKNNEEHFIECFCGYINNKEQKSDYKTLINNINFKKLFIKEEDKIELIKNCKNTKFLSEFIYNFRLNSTTIINVIDKLDNKGQINLIYNACLDAFKGQPTSILNIEKFVKSQKSKELKDISTGLTKIENDIDILLNGNELHK